MYLQENQTFDNRYRLVRRLGNGASADVWLAIDTTAAGMKVAIKVFNAHNGMDTMGMQNFQREFTGVFNIKHQNLLTPTNYALFNGTPYLVMPYLENGSVQALIGRSSDNDVARFLYHVASGLACLHEHNIVHQDIKPDNVLLDSECNFLITDFGISISSNDYGRATTGAGTKAYMSPERFSQGARATMMSDVWAMGATAYEMLSGDAPFGDNGGIVQASGESIPDMPSTVHPTLRKLILKCLDADPNARPTASEVAQATGRYIKTGSWKSENLKMKLIAASVVFVALLAGLYAVDYFRTKVYYYKDYVTEWAVPQGIGRLSGSDMRNREQTYKFEYSRHKLQRVTLVNSKGKVISHSDSEGLKNKYDDIRFSYTASGKVDYAIIYDKCGKLLYKMDYDENLKTVTFRQNDKYGTEMNLPSNMSDLSSGRFDLTAEKSRISKYILEYNEKGLLIKRLYVGIGNVPRTNNDNIYGEEYEYDEKGRIIGEKFLGPDGKLTCNNEGLASKEFTYDDDYNCISAKYYNLDHELTSDGLGAKYYKFSHDKYGNRTSETHWLSDNEPSIIQGTAIHEIRWEYKDGQNVKRTFFDEKGKQMFCSQGYSSIAYEYDENGFCIKETFLDDKDSVTTCNSDQDVYSYRVFKNDNFGNNLERYCLDVDNKEIENVDGIFKYVFTYDSIGNITSQKFYDKQEKPYLYGGFYHEVRIKYDECYRMNNISFYDISGERSLNGENFAEIRVEYNNQGSVTRIETLGKNSEKTCSNNKYAIEVREYDDQGLEISRKYFDADESPCENKNGVASYEFSYDKKTDKVAISKQFDKNGECIAVLHSKYDNRGNLIESKNLDDDGNLVNGYVIRNYKYNKLNQIIEEWYTNLKGDLVNDVDASYAKIVYKYDKMGNVTEKTYWGTFGDAAALADGTHKWVHEYNKLGQEIHQVSYGVSGEPIKTEDGDAEIKTEYDKYGRKTTEFILDGHGGKTNGVDGWYKHTLEYNIRGQVIKEVFYGKDNKLAASVEKEYAKIENEYDSHGNVTKEKRYDAEGKCISVCTYQYNKQNKLVLMLIKDAKGNLYDEQNGYSKVEIKYDNTGITPVSEKLINSQSELIASRTYDKDSLEWGEYDVTAAGKAFIWRQRVKDMADGGPFSLADGILCTSINYSSSSVTFNIKLTDASSSEIYVPGLRQIVASWKGSLRNNMDIPIGITVKLNIYDKYNRYLCSV